MHLLALFKKINVSLVNKNITFFFTFTDRINEVYFLFLVKPTLLDGCAHALCS